MVVVCLSLDPFRPFSSAALDQDRTMRLSVPMTDGKDVGASVLEQTEIGCWGGIGSRLRRLKAKVVFL